MQEATVNTINPKQHGWNPTSLISYYVQVISEQSKSISNFRNFHSKVKMSFTMSKNNEVVLNHYFWTTNQMCSEDSKHF